MFLTDDELVELTGYRQRPKQAEWLREHGWVYYPRADGSPVVSREYAQQQLGARATPPKRVRAKPNFNAIP